jgi:phosphate transport system substrate-binding protein
MKLKLFAGVAIVNIVTTSGAFALDPGLPVYQVVPGISGQIKSVGSDTLSNEVELWAKGFRELYPDVKIEFEAKGSATAPPALLQGASQFGPMSVPMTAEELGASKRNLVISPRASGSRSMRWPSCQQGQSNPVFDVAASGSDVFLDAQGERRQDHQHMG